MGNISSCNTINNTKPLINIGPKPSVTYNAENQIDEPTVYSNGKSARDATTEEKNYETSIIEQAIHDSVLSGDNHSFDSELFYCWVTGSIEDATSWQFKFNLHIIDKQGKQGCYKFTTDYTKVQNIYCAAYNSRKKYFPQSKFSNQFNEDHTNNEKLTLMQKYMVLYEVLWADKSKPSTAQDVQTCCDVLIKLLNAPLFVQQKSNVFFGLGMTLKTLQIRDLLQKVAKQRIGSLTHRAKRYSDNDSKSTMYDQIQWSHVTFHTISLVERPNDLTSNHWAIKFEGDGYLLSLDWFNKDVVYYQVLQNDAIGQKIAWYSWINQTRFIHHWSERVRVNNLKVTFYDIGRLVCKWKAIYQKYHVFDNNCQHFARDILSAFAVNAAKKLTDDAQNVFITANMTLKTEIERVDLISNKLNQQLRQDYEKKKKDEIWLWLNNIGLPQYYHVFKAEEITLNILQKYGVNAIKKLQRIVVDEEHCKQILSQMDILQQKQYEDNWEGIKSFLTDLKLKDTQYVIDQFKEQSIDDIATLCDLNDATLKAQIRINAWGSRNKIMRAIKKLRYSVNIREQF